MFSYVIDKIEKLFIYEDFELLVRQSKFVLTKI